MLNITFFAACVVIDHKRATANRADCCCCFTLKIPHSMFPELVVGANGDEERTDNTDNEQATRLSYCCCCHKIPTELSRKMFKKIGAAMTYWYVKAIILLIAGGMLGFSIYGATQLEQDFKIEWFLPDSSYLQEYYAWQDEFFSAGTPIFIYSRDIEYLEYKEELLECNALLRNADYLTGFPRDWHQPFWSYIDSRSDITITTESQFSTELFKWMNTSGAQYDGLVAWKNETIPELGIAGAFMIGGYKESAVQDASAQVDAMYAIRDDMTEIVGDYDGIFGFTFQMLFWEQYAVIATEFYRNLILAVCVVFGIALILIPKISAALLVLFTVTCTIVDVLGFMWLWGLTIDAVTVCYTVIAIGLAVDYSAHVGEAFMLSPGNTKGEKVYMICSEIYGKLYPSNSCNEYTDD